MPADVALDVHRLLVSDGANDVVWSIDLRSGRETVLAGNGTAGHGGDGGPATRAELNRPAGLAVAGRGLYIADAGNNRVRRVDLATGVISTVAGDGHTGASAAGTGGRGDTGLGDGGPAVRAGLYSPDALAVSGSDLYVADAYDNRVRRVDLATGIISTVAGNGEHGDSGDGGPATRATLAFPQGVAAGPDGTLYISDTDNSVVRRVDLATGIITTVAGNRLAGFAGDGGPATAARLDFPTQIDVPGDGSLLVADSTNDAVRRVDLATGIITTLAGTGRPGFSGDGGPARASELSNPTGVAEAGDGTVYIADSYNDRVRAVSPGGTATTLAGNGTPAVSGGAPGRMSNPSGIAADAHGDLFAADTGNDEVVERTAAGTVSIVAGTGAAGDTGDGGAAVRATLSSPVGLALDGRGTLYIADSGNDAVRAVDLATGLITTVAGSGVPGRGPDGTPARSTLLDDPTGVAVDTSGDLFVADSGNDRVVEFAGAPRSGSAPSSPAVAASLGPVRTVAGDGQPGYSGDGGPAARAGLFDPTGVALDPRGDLYIADRYDNRVREVDGSTSVITTVAGTGSPGSAGDGGPARTAMLAFPYGVAVDASGDLFVADSDNERVREVVSHGSTMTTVAGSGVLGFAGDGGPPRAAEFSVPTGVAVGTGGRLYVADGGNGRVRSVSGVTRGHADVPRAASVPGSPPSDASALAPAAPAPAAPAPAAPVQAAPSPAASGPVALAPSSAPSGGPAGGAPAGNPGFDPSGVAAPVVAPRAALRVPSAATAAPGAGGALSTAEAAGPLPPGSPAVDVLGDSLAYTLAEGLVPWGVPYGTNVVNAATLGCGILTGGPIEVSGAQSAQPALCDTWAASWSERVARDRPSVAAVLAGRWEIVDRVHVGSWSHIGEPRFDAYIEGQLKAAVNAASAARAVVFLTMPYLLPAASPTGPGVYPETDPLRVDEFNSLVYSAARAFPGRAYVFDLNAALDPGGHFSLAVGGRTVRWPDGTHITTAGAALVAPALLPSIDRLAG